MTSSITIRLSYCSNWCSAVLANRSKKVWAWDIAEFYNTIYCRMKSTIILTLTVKLLVISLLFCFTQNAYHLNCCFNMKRLNWEVQQFSGTKYLWTLISRTFKISQIPWVCQSYSDISNTMGMSKLLRYLKYKAYVKVTQISQIQWVCQSYSDNSNFSPFPSSSR
jgi:hypothetical protein